MFSPALIVMAICALQLVSGQALGENIIPDPIFDVSTGWEWDNTVLASEATGNVSVVANALRIKSTSMGYEDKADMNENQVAALYRYDEAPYGDFLGAYLMSLDAKSSNDTTPLKAGLRAWEVADEEQDKHNHNAINMKYSKSEYISQYEYTNYHGFTFNNPIFNKELVQIRIMVGGQVGDVDIDNFYCRPILDILNGGFEYDSLLFGWKLSNNDSASFSTDTVKTGKQALKVHATQGVNASLTNQYLHYEGNDTDTITFNVMGNVGDTVVFKVQPWTYEASAVQHKIKSNDASEVEVDTWVLPEGADTGYVEHQVIVDPNDINPETAGDMVYLQYIIEFIGVDTNGVNTFFIDDVNFDINTSSVSPVTSVTSSVNMYPNPANNMVYFENANNAFVTVYSITGQAVVSQQLEGNALNIQELNSGMYVVSVQTSNETVVKKLQVR